MSREELNNLYDLLDKFCDKYTETEEEWNPVYEVLDMIGEQLKVSDCWNIRKVG